ncbi:MAG: hypothetical protein RID18_08300 [Cytophagales bacterium]
MHIALHQNQQTHKSSFSFKWSEFLNKYSVRYKTLDFLHFGSLKRISDFDAVMWHFFHNPLDKMAAFAILNSLELKSEILVWPNQSTRWHFDDKVAQYFLLKSHNLPVVDSWVFWSEAAALDALPKLKTPIVAKLKSGAGSANVMLLENNKEITQHIERSFRQGIFPYTLNEFRNSRSGNLALRMKESFDFITTSIYPSLPTTNWLPEKGYVYFQKFLNKNPFDTRITVIGDRAFGFLRFNRTNDFRASGSGKLDHNPSNVDLECVSIAFRISQKFGFQSMAYDFLYDQGVPLIVEISYGYDDTAIYNCPGHWDKSMNWVEGNMWPQEAHVVDLIEQINGAK